MGELITANNSISFTDNSLYKPFIDFLDVREKSIETYLSGVKRFLQFLIDNSITQPAREDIIAFIKYLEAEGLKTTTIHGYIVSVKIFFSFLEQEGLYPDIAKRIKTPSVDRSFKKDYLTASQAHKLLASIETDTEKGKRDFAILSLMLTTGLRTIEVSRANREDLRARGDSMVLYVMGKGKSSKSEYVKIDDNVEDALRDYFSCIKMLTRADTPLFISTSNNNRGHRISTRSIRQIVKSRLIDAGYNSERLTAHSTRHTAGALNLLNGGTLEETAVLLRHASTDTTRIYSHMIERDNNESERRIANAIFNNT